MDVLRAASGLFSWMRSCKGRTTNEEHVVRAGLGDEKIRIDSIGVVVPRRARWPGLDMQEPRTPRHPGVDFSSLARSIGGNGNACVRQTRREFRWNRVGIPFPRLIELETLRQACRACSFRRKRSWIIYCRLVWCERKILFQLIIYDRIRVSERAAEYWGNCATSDDLAGCDLRGVRRGRMVKLSCASWEYEVCGSNGPVDMED